MSEFSHIVCPHCETVNRIPAVRLGEEPWQPLAEREIIVLAGGKILTRQLVSGS